MNIPDIYRMISSQKIIGGICSRIGGRMENQDCADFADTPLGTLIIVCDGMGGRTGGAVASKTAVKSIISRLMQTESCSDKKQMLVDAIQYANNVIRELGGGDLRFKGMGTTVAAVLVTEESAIISHVGDTRIYQMRHRRKVFRSNDHSMVFELVRNKTLTEEQARLSAQSNIILRALGVAPSVEVDVVELSYRKGDRFVLCTDGFWGAMPEADFIRKVSDRGVIDDMLRHLANEVDCVGRDMGNNHDNLTAAVFDMTCNSAHSKTFWQKIMEKI